MLLIAHRVILAALRGRGSEERTVATVVLAAVTALKQELRSELRFPIRIDFVIDAQYRSLALWHQSHTAFRGMILIKESDMTTAFLVR